MSRPGLVPSLLAFIVLVVVIVGSFAFLAVQTGPGTTTNTQPTVESTNSADGLRLSLSVTPPEAYPGGSFNVAISDFNTLGMTNTPTIAGIPTAGGNTLLLGPCSQLPLGFGVWEGYYLAGNLSAAPPLNLFQPGAYSCPAEFAVAYFSFSPLSEDVSLYSPQPNGSGNATVPTKMWTTPDAFTQGFSGYWTDKGVFQQFQPGVYTLVGGDDYGQLTILHFYVGQSETTYTLATSSQSSTSTSGQIPPLPSGENLSAPSFQGLELVVSTNATEVPVGDSVQVNLSEFNTLSTLNNVSAAHDWPTQVALGSCENIYVQPFGIAVYVGHVDGQNLSQGERVNVFPPTACPQYIRLVTGYEFQPVSDLAVVLPSFGATPSPLVGSVVIGMSSPPQGQPLPPGNYTIVAADEWGALAFVYIAVQ
jgi:hypothetical protein